MYNFKNKTEQTMSTKHILQQIIKADHQPAKLIRCPSCLQIKPAAFLDSSTGKEYCIDCARKFEQKGSVVLSRKGQTSFSIINDYGEICLISREQKRLLSLLRDKYFKYRFNLFQAIAEVIGKPVDWVDTQVKFLSDEGFDIPNRHQRREALHKYIHANILRFKARNISDYRLYMKLADAIADETGHSPKIIRSICRGYLTFLSVNQHKNQFFANINAEVMQLFKSQPEERFTLAQIESNLALKAKRSQIRNTCDRLAKQGTLRKAKGRKQVYFSLS